MATVTITFTDIVDEDGTETVSVSTTFDPPIKKDEELTAAQSGAMTMLQSLHDQVHVVSDEWEVDGEMVAADELLADDDLDGPEHWFGIDAPEGNN